MSYCNCKIIDILKALVICLDYYGDEPNPEIGLTSAIEKVALQSLFSCAEKIKKKRLIQFKIVDSDK